MPDADFTSGHFLGLRPRTPCGWPASRGRPAALDEPPADRQLAQAVARGQGAGGGVLARTSFHALLDAITVCARPGRLVLLDDRVYPVAGWAAAAGTWEGGGSVQLYRHLSHADAAARARAAGRPVVVVTDGLCGACLRPAPLGRLAEIASSSGGYLVVDDSLAVGVRSERGSRRLRSNVPDRTVWVASCAKAYAAPLAVMTGPRRVIDSVRTDGPSRLHASPPPAADVAALRWARSRPDLAERRRRLAGLVVRVREAATSLGLDPVGVPFPVVHLVPHHTSPEAVQRGLAALGVRTLVTAGRCTGRAVLTICLRADVADRDIDRLLAGLVAVVPRRAA